MGSNNTKIIYLPSLSYTSFHHSYILIDLWMSALSFYELLGPSTKVSVVPVLHCTDSLSCCRSHSFTFLKSTETLFCTHITFDQIYRQFEIDTQSVNGFFAIFSTLTSFPSALICLSCILRRLSPFIKELHFCPNICQLLGHRLRLSSYVNIEISLYHRGWAHMGHHLVWVMLLILFMQMLSPADSRMKSAEKAQMTFVHFYQSLCSLQRGRRKHSYRRRIRVI